MAQSDLADLVRRGVAVIVAACDGDMRPELGRAWGPTLSGDGERLTVCVEASPDSAMARILQPGAPTAAMITRLASPAIVTLGGPVVELAAPGPDRLHAVAGHVEAFVAELAAVGVPAATARALVAPDLCCVTIELGRPARRDPRTGSIVPSGDVDLDGIRDCLHAGLPSPLATCSPDGTPQVSFISRVQYLDSERVATSRQSFSPALAHLNARPLSQAFVVRPTTGEEFRVDLRYLHTLAAGEEFDAMRATLDAIATDAGVGPAYRLRGVDVHQVLRCSRVRRSPYVSAATGAPDPLVTLERFARRLEGATDVQDVQHQALDALDDLLGFRFAVLFTPDAIRARLVATLTSGDARAVLGAEADPATGLIGTAAAHRRVLLTGNLARVRAMADGPTAHQWSPVPLSGLPGPRSAAAVPLVVGRDLLGVIYLESAQPYAFIGPVEALLRIIGAHTAAAMAARSGSVTRSRRTPAGAAVPDGGPPMQLVHYRADDTVLCDSAYIVKGVPGRILWRMVEAHATTGRVVFTNRELRLDESLELPMGNDNLEARLLVLRRRLADLGCGITLERVGRGRLELRLDRPAELRVVPTVGMRGAGPGGRRMERSVPPRGLRRP